jgi:hypothetical protein
MVFLIVARLVDDLPFHSCFWKRKYAFGAARIKKSEIDTGEMV